MNKNTLIIGIIIIIVLAIVGFLIFNNNKVVDNQTQIANSPELQTELNSLNETDNPLTTEYEPEIIDVQ